MNSSLHPNSTLIDRLGGTMAASRFFEVRAPSISKWRKTGIPRARMMYLRLARPDIFGVSPSEKKSFNSFPSPHSHAADAGVGV